MNEYRLLRYSYLSIYHTYIARNYSATRNICHLYLCIQADVESRAREREYKQEERMYMCAIRYVKT